MWAGNEQINLLIRGSDETREGTMSAEGVTHHIHTEDVPWLHVQFHTTFPLGVSVFHHVAGVLPGQSLGVCCPVVRGKVPIFSPAFHLPHGGDTVHSEAHRRARTGEPGQGVGRLACLLWVASPRVVEGCMLVAGEVEGQRCRDGCRPTAWSWCHSRLQGRVGEQRRPTSHVCSEQPLPVKSERELRSLQSCSVWGDPSSLGKGLVLHWWST